MLYSLEWNVRWPVSVSNEGSTTCLIFLSHILTVMNAVQATGQTKDSCIRKGPLSLSLSRSNWFVIHCTWLLMLSFVFTPPDIIILFLILGLILQSWAAKHSSWWSFRSFWWRLFFRKESDVDRNMRACQWTRNQGHGLTHSIFLLLLLLLLLLHIESSHLLLSLSKSSIRMERCDSLLSRSTIYLGHQ